MSSIRKTKKAMKKSNGFFTVVVDNGMCFCTSDGRTIVLSGTHAFEWQVTIAGENSLTVIKFANRVKATKEFNKYRRKR